MLVSLQIDRRSVVEAPYTTGLLLTVSRGGRLLLSPTSRLAFHAPLIITGFTAATRPHHLHPLLSQPLSRPKTLPSLPLSPPPNQIVRPPFSQPRELDDDGRGQLRLLVARPSVMSAATAHTDGQMRVADRGCILND